MKSEYGRTRRNRVRKKKGVEQNEEGKGSQEGLDIASILIDFFFKEEDYILT